MKWAKILRRKAQANRRFVEPFPGRKRLVQIAVKCACLGLSLTSLGAAPPGTGDEMGGVFSYD